MSLIMDVIGLEPSELSALLLEKTATFDFVYTIASASIHQSATDLVKIYMIYRICHELTVEIKSY